jgi:predicted alpha/beta superfamily hydrolase
MIIHRYGDENSSVVLIQPVDSHDLEGMDSEIDKIKTLSGKSFLMLAVETDDWNSDLSPWPASPVFGSIPFGGKAEDTLSFILTNCVEKGDGRKYCIGGYSLAALFALWAGTKTDVFSAVAAASPSVWFPGFTEYLTGHEMKAADVYLSLGDREEKTRNPVMREVGRCITECRDILLAQGRNCVLEWNEGNHFRDSDIRTAKAFARLLSADS